MNVTQDNVLSRDLGLGRTPTFIILKHGSSKITAIEGAQPFEVFDDTMKQVLENTP
jgi:predicted DsbA family dithiol-disulfide isomerase